MPSDQERSPRTALPSGRASPFAPPPAAWGCTRRRASLPLADSAFRKFDDCDRSSFELRRSGRRAGGVHLAGGLRPAAPFARILQPRGFLGRCASRADAPRARSCSRRWNILPLLLSILNVGDTLQVKRRQTANRLFTSDCERFCHLPGIPCLFSPGSSSPWGERTRGRDGPTARPHSLGRSRGPARVSPLCSSLCIENTGSS